MPYKIPMDRLFASPLSASETLDDLALQAGQNRITQADLARQRFDEIMGRSSDLSTFEPAVLDNTQLIPNAEPYSALSVRQAPPSVVGGMFSPEISRAAEMQYLQGRQKEMRDRALAFAQLSPMQQADYGFYRGGQQLGDVLGGALGGQDPQLKLISQRQRLLSQLDRSDPESYKKIALQAQQMGDSELATLVSETGRKLELDTSLIKQRGREAKGADPFQQLLRSGKYTPASMATYEISGNVADLREVDSPDKVPQDIQKARLVAQGKGFKEGTPEFNAEIVKQLEKPSTEPSVGSDREAIAKDLFFKPFSQLTQEQVKAVNAKKKADDEKLAREGAPKERQDKAILANKAKLAETVETEAYGASDRLTLARNLKTLLPQAFTGLGSDVALDASRLAEVFGINIQGVPASQIIDTILGELTIGAASNLKGSLSDKDVKFLKETIGSRGLSLRTLQYVADRIEENALIDSAVNDALATYLADEKNDLNKYNFPAERQRITEQIRKDKKRLQELREKQQKSK